MAWLRAFDDPITLIDGRVLRPHLHAHARCGYEANGFGSHPINRLSMWAGPSNRLAVDGKQEAISSDRPSDLRSDFWVDAGRFVADPHSSECAYRVRKRVPVNLRDHVGEHSCVKNNECHTSGRRFGCCGDVMQEISTSYAWRLLPCNFDRSAQPFSSRVLLGPNQCLQPIHVDRRSNTQWVQVKTAPPSNPGKRRW